MLSVSRPGKLMVSRPSYRLEFRASSAEPAGWSKSWGRTAGPRILRIDTCASLESLASTAWIHLVAPPGELVKRGSRFSLELDAGRSANASDLATAGGDTSRLVLKGIVTGGTEGPMPTIDCESSLGALERARINLSLAARPAEDVISRLARSQRAVKFATGCPAHSGLLRAKATFDSASSVADHIRRLSRLAGFVVYPTPEDEFFVGPWKPLKTAGPAGVPTARQVTHDLRPEAMLSVEVEPVPEPRPRHALTFSDPRGKNEGLIVVSRKSIDAQISGKRRPGSDLNVEGLSPKGAKKALENVFRMENVEARLRLETLG
ncbi:MAG TPA: hypothetical protein VI893_05120, partial [Thermoplasmata archaeon]|nr:hypothetical protein [Thermoplasmata archaeon]